MQQLLNPVICIVGPTASGKTTLAQALAEHFQAAVLSADSMQVYRGMDIGTGKIAECDRTVPYYGLDLVEPGQPYSASLFQEYGRNLIEQRDHQGAQTIVCGGTGFYIRALIDDFVFPQGEQIANPIREHYTRLLEEQGPSVVWEELNALDPQSAAVIPVNDSKRVIRALEMLDEGIHYSDQKEQFTHIGAYYPAIQIGLSVETEVLNGRINTRVDAMLENGLLDEVKNLLEAGYEEAITANQAIGYKEFVPYLRGECKLDEAIEQVKLSTRRYAKRQRTWFRRDERIHWINATDSDLDSLVNNSIEIIQGALHE